MTREQRIKVAREEHAAMHAYCIWRRNPRAKFERLCPDPCHRRPR